MDGERLPYQVALRAIGAYLDEIGASSFNVLEINDGFNLRYQTGSGAPQLSDKLFSRGQLESAESDSRKGRSLTPHLHLKRDPEESGYQDFLRALGHELDKVAAYDILVEQVENEVLLTFVELDPAHGVAARKRMMIFGPKERKFILDHSYRRRKDQTNPGLLNRFGRAASTR